MNLAAVRCMPFDWVEVTTNSSSGETRCMPDRYTIVSVDAVLLTALGLRVETLPFLDVVLALSFRKVTRVPVGHAGESSKLSPSRLKKLE